MNACCLRFVTMAGLKSARSAQSLSTQLSRSLRFAAIKYQRGRKRQLSLLPTLHSTHTGQSDYRMRIAKIGASLAIGSAAVMVHIVKTPDRPIAPVATTPPATQDLSEIATKSEPEEVDTNRPAVEISTVVSDGAVRNQVRVNDTAVLSFRVDERDRAAIVAKRLNAMANMDQLVPDLAVPDTVNGLPVASIDDEVMFTVDRQTAEWYGKTPEDLTVMWVNNLRIALKGSPLSSTEAANYKYRFNPKPIDFEGLASWYGPYFYGRPTASGELFVPGTMTAAHKTLPLGTYLEVTSPHTGRTIVVRVNDRGPYIGPRVLDLSETAAQELGVLEMGVSNVQVRIIEGPGG